MPTDKIRENKLRRYASRQGLVLRRSRRRDTYATDYGVYWLDDKAGIIVHGGETGTSLDAIEAYLRPVRS